MYGYQLVKEMDRRSSGYFRLKEGALYPALHRLERDGVVEGSWQESPSGQNRRYCHVTEPGMAKLESMLHEWDLSTRAVDLIAQPVGTLVRGALKRPCPPGPRLPQQPGPAPAPIATSATRYPQ